ncbi:MAG: DUF2807 domain-containing protein [Bacteroidales bacterium]|nr:DUF2807 domain-containing protein [Bacteroidales bacterium]
MKSLTKKIGLLFVVLFAGYSLQASNLKFSDVISQNRSLDEFTSIKLMCSADVYITQGNTQEVTVKADSKNIDMLQTRVENGTLIIDVKKHWGSLNFHVLDVYITVKQLNEISSYGSGDIKLKNGFKADDFTVSVNGSGDLTANLEVHNMKLNMRGSGDSKISGVTGTFELSVHGSGDIEGTDLQLENCAVESLGSGDIELSGTTDALSISQKGSGDFEGYGLQTKSVSISNFGSGDAMVNVSQIIRAKLHGSGDVFYHGEPSKVLVSALGSGEVYKK